MNKNIIYNVLSLINVFTGLLFIILLGNKFGASLETDIYFISLVMITYMSLIVNIVWSAVKHYYVEIKKNNLYESKITYNVLLNNIILVSLFIITVYYVISLTTSLISTEKKQFFDIFILYLLIRCVINFKKSIINLEHYYAQGYIVEILINSSNILVFLIIDDLQIVYFAYSTIIGSLIGLFYQFYIVKYKLNIRYSFILIYNDFYKEIYLNSLKLNIGGLMYSIKDILVISVLTQFGVGIYSIYSYANKFIGVILQVVNAPIYNIFVTNTTHAVSKKDFKEAILLKNKIHITLFVLYSLSCIITYFMIPYILTILFSDKFTNDEIMNMQYIFIFLSIIYLIVTLEGPYLTLINLIKEYNYVLLTNFIFFIVILLSFIMFKNYNFTYTGFFIFLIISQSINFFMYKYKYAKINKEING